MLNRSHLNIVSTAVDMAEHNELVAIVGEDTDLLVLLTALAPPSSNIFLLKPGKGVTGNTIYSPTNFKLSHGVKENILFLHAFSGCDSTSALYRQGKMKFAKLMEKDSDLVQVARTFTSGSASTEEIASAGEKFLARLYSSSTSGEESLNQMRYTIFSKSLSKLGFELASLPPTKSAAHQHSLRTYH